LSSPDREARTSLLSASVVIPQHVVRRAFAMETVVLNLQSGMYHGLNSTGARMLDALESSSTVGDAAADLAVEYGIGQEKIEDDLCDLCSRLLERGLIEINNGARD
jgi:hypothetical protein